MSTSKGSTPLMRQYHGIKERHPNALLLFRMGDFYETFEEDAQTISEILGITLTSRSNGAASDVPMAGFPHHAIDKHLPKLIRAGHRVAICEQVEDASASSKIVKREVVEVVTPGVSFHDQLLAPKRSNFLAAVHWDGDRAGYAFVDASTGEFFVAELEAGELPDMLESTQPAELLLDKRRMGRLSFLREQSFTVTTQEDWVFSYDFAYETLTQHFETHSLKGFGVDEMRPGLCAAGAALHYLRETQKGSLPHIRKIRRFSSSDFMALDPQTKRNLELVTPMRDGIQEGALVDIVDATVTSMGGRLLRRWLLRPLRVREAIEARQEAVAELVEGPKWRHNLRETLGGVGDMERLAARVATHRAGPREVAAIGGGLRRIQPVIDGLGGSEADELGRIGRELDPCGDLIALIDEALAEDPPASVGDGGVIREGFSDELDELRTLARSGKEWLAELEERESERTSIPSLKVGFNKVFGYYLEVTNTHKEKVPDDYIRKQTLVNSERYITPELKEYEEKILTAEEKIASLEVELYQSLRRKLADHVERLQQNAHLVATLDCYTCFAEIAERHGYVRPEVHEGRSLEIVEGRHPVVEQMLEIGERFIPNDVRLDPETQQILLITGPNMAGKSVVLRQTGLIVLLAQVGSFVPAKAARIGIVDRIFTRVGASDNLAGGESTFLVEMNETANILHNATPHSLILLDEVGRGTSTFDGLSIAWSLVEHLHEEPSVAARTLFATHYHELNELADRFERIRNYRIQVQEHEGQVIFLRTLIPGGADHSYGIEVARMAGLPQPVIERARGVLHSLEQQRVSVDADGPSHVRRAEAEQVPERSQMHLFGGEADPLAAQIREEVEMLDVDRLSPIEALLKLNELKQLLKRKAS